MADKNSLTAAQLRVLLSYDPQTGKFFWNVAPNGRVKIGTEAGSIKRKKYIYIGIGRNIYRAHRLAWLYMTGAWPVAQIDHINLRKSDNRFTNLRPASIAENARNRIARKDNRLQIKGVGWHKASQKWVARIQENGKRVHLGCFDSTEAATAAYRKAAAKLHSSFARS